MTPLGTSLLFWLSALTALAGCDGDLPEPPMSAEVPDARLRVTLTLASNGAVAQVVASLSDEGTAVALSGGDRLVAGPAGEPEEEMVAVETGYAAQFETPAEAFVVAFVRGSGTRFEASLALPPSFAIDAFDEPVSRATPIEVSWAPADGEHTMTLELHGPCMESPLRRTLQTDTGSFAISPADLFVVDPTAACDLDLFVFRRLAPTVTFDGLGPPGNASLEQVRDVVVSTTP